MSNILHSLSKLAQHWLQLTPRVVPRAPLR